MSPSVAVQDLGFGGGPFYKVEVVGWYVNKQKQYEDFEAEACVLY